MFGLALFLFVGACGTGEATSASHSFEDVAHEAYRAGDLRGALEFLGMSIERDQDWDVGRLYVRWLCELAGESPFEAARSFGDFLAEHAALVDEEDLPDVLDALESHRDAALIPLVQLLDVLPKALPSLRDDLRERRNRVMEVLCPPAPEPAVSYKVVCGW